MYQILNKSALKFGLLALCAVYPSLGWAIPSAYSATYRVEYGQMAIGNLAQDFVPNKNGHYELELKSQTAIPFYSHATSQKSIGIFRNQYPVPQCYIENVEQKSTSFCFTPVNLNKLYQAKQVPLNTPIYDELSYQLALQQDLAAGKKRFNYWIYQKNKLKFYQLSVIGEEWLSTPMGKIFTTKVQRNNSGKRITVLYLANEYNYLPVVLAQYRPNKPEVRISMTELKISSPLARK